MDALRRAQAAQQRVALKSEALQTLLEDSIKATSKPQYKAAKKAKPEGREIVLPQHFDLQDFLRRVEHAMDAENADAKHAAEETTDGTFPEDMRAVLNKQPVDRLDSELEASELKKHVQDIKLFQRVPRAKQLDFLRMLRYRTVNEGETVFDVGQEATDMFVVLSGSVSVMSTYRGKKLKKLADTTTLTSVNELLAEEGGRSASHESMEGVLRGSSVPVEDDGERLTEKAIELKDRVSGLQRSGSMSESKAEVSVSTGVGGALHEIVRLRPGDAFGERSLVEGGDRNSVARAAESTELLVITRWVYHRYIREVSERVLRRVRHEFIKAGIDDIPEDPPNMSKGRLAALLSEFSLRNVRKSEEHTDEQRQQRAAKKRAIVDKYLTPFYLERNLEISDRVAKASLFLDDAAASRTMRAHRSGPVARFLDLCYNSTGFELLLFVVVILHMVLAVYEAPSWRDYESDEYKDRFWTTISLEWVCIGFYSIELAYVMWDFGPFWFFGSRKRSFRFLLNLCFIIDAAIACTLIADNNISLSTYIRFSRFLRPFMLLYRSRLLRKMFVITLQAIPRVLELIVVIFSAIGVFAVVGLFLFKLERDVYNSAQWDPANFQTSVLYGSCAPRSNVTDGLFTGACPDLPDFIFDSFSKSLYESMLALYVLLTTANYPDITWPAYVTNHMYLGYWMSYNVFVQFFLLSILVAGMFSAYKSTLSAHNAYDMLQERRSLKAAFVVMDVHDCGLLTFDSFALLMHHRGLFPKDYQLRTVWTLLDKDGDGTTDLKEFQHAILDLMTVQVRSKRHKGDKSSDEDERSLRSALLYGVPVMAFIFLNPLYETFFSFVTVVDAASLLVLSHELNVFDYIDLVCLLYFVLDIIGSFLAMGMHKFVASPWKRFDLIVTLFHTMGVIHTFTDVFRDAGVPVIGVLRYFAFLRFLRTVNLLWQIDAVRRFIDPTSTKRPQATLTETVISMVPVYLVIVFSLVSIVMYPFAIAGMEIFNGPESLAGVVRCSDAGVLNYDVYARFCDLTTALTSLFQCLVTSNWHVQMYDAMGKMRPAVGVYFVCFSVFTLYLMINLLLAVFIDVFNKHRVAVGGAEESLSAALGKQRKPDSNHKAEENGGPSAAAKSRSKMRSVERFDMADEKDIDQIELIRTVNLARLARETDGDN